MNTLHHSLQHKIYLTTALGFLRQDLAIYLQPISAKLLFFQITNNLERGQLLMILIEEMAKVIASSDQAEACNISRRFSVQSNFSRLTNESLFSDRRVAGQCIN